MAVKYHCRNILISDEAKDNVVVLANLVEYVRKQVSFIVVVMVILIT